MREAYVNQDFEQYYRSAPASEFASHVFTNNVQVSIYAFAAGIAFCVLTGFILVLNGANAGVAGGLFAAVGQQPKFWGLILPHGLLELTAVFIAGGAGLRLGWTLIDPGDRTRRAALAEEGRRALPIIAGLVLVFAVAGTIEGFVAADVGPRGHRGCGRARPALVVVHPGPGCCRPGPDRRPPRNQLTATGGRSP